LITLGNISKQKRYNIHSITKKNKEHRLAPRAMYWRI